MKKIVLGLSLILTLLFMIGCVEKLSDEQLAKELSSLPEEELNYVLEENSALTGEAFRTLSISPTKKSNLNYLRSSYQNYKSKYENPKLQPIYPYCIDPDGFDIYHQNMTKGYLTKDRMIPYKDSCQLVNGKILLMEGYCNNSEAKFKYVECPEEYSCNEGQCNKITKIISEPGEYIVDVGTVIEGYEDEFYLKLTSMEGGYPPTRIIFKGYVKIDDKYFPLGQEILQTDNIIARYGEPLIGQHYDIFFRGFTEDLKPIIEKSPLPCDELFSLIDPRFRQSDASFNCIYEENPYVEKYFYKNFIGYAPKGYSQLAECSARGIEKDLEDIYRITGVSPPFKIKVAGYLNYSGFSGGAYSPGTNNIHKDVDFNNQDRINNAIYYCQEQLNGNNITGFYTHESTHMAIAYDFHTNDNCLMFEEGLANFVEKKSKFDRGDFGYYVFGYDENGDPIYTPWESLWEEYGSDPIPKTFNSVMLCTDEGWGTGIGTDLETPSGIHNYTNFSNVDCNYGNYDYYHDGECFWYYVYTTYGADKFKEVMQRLDELRYINSMEDPLPNFDFYRDVLIETLGKEILNITKERYGLPVYGTYG